MTVDLRLPGCLLLLVLAGCRTAGAIGPAEVDATTGTARFQCGPTDDLELALSVSSPTAGDEAAGTLDATLDSQQWSALARGERRLVLAPASATWCIRDGACEAPGGLVFEFDRVGLQDGDVLSGSVEIRIEQRTISLPLRARVQRPEQRCG